MSTPPGFSPPIPAWREGSSGIRSCLFRNTYIWMNSGRSFWFFPTAVGRKSLLALGGVEDMAGISVPFLETKFVPMNVLDRLSSRYGVLFLKNDVTMTITMNEGKMGG